MAAYSVATLNAKLILFSVIGLGLSVYAFIVENKIEHNKNYEAMCDISEHMSCTKAFSSQYGKGFGIIPENSIFYQPNSLYGILHYCIVIAFSMYNSLSSIKILLIFVILSNISSVYFAYILYFILADFCIVCVSIYVVNAALLLYTISKYAVVKNIQLKQKQKQA